MGAIFGWIAIGLVVGLIGKFLMPGRDPGGLVVPAVAGIAGAILAGLGGLIAGIDPGDDPRGWIWAAAGAAIFVIFYRLVMKARA